MIQLIEAASVMELIDWRQFTKTLERTTDSTWGIALLLTFLSVMLCRPASEGEVDRHKS